MKVNLKKIGAIVAGATILASSAVFADLMFGSTKLVDENGAPVAKVVVGSRAAPSDAVAASLIAGKLASSTYKTQTLTALVAGTAACRAGNASATGTCSVTDKSARIQVDVPNSVTSGTWTGTNYIGDYLDRTLFDRKSHDTTYSSETDYAFPMTGSDTSDNANPFTDGASSNLGQSETILYRVSGGMFGPFVTSTLTDPTAGNSYSEQQNLWVKGDNHYSKNDAQVIGRMDYLAYTIKFDGPGSRQMGIPVCTTPVDSNYAGCTSTDDRTETHKVTVKFLGEDWIISSMSNPTTTGASNSNLNSETGLIAGGTVKLAKETISGLVNQGENLPSGGLKFQLDDLEAHGETTSAIISVLDANGNILKKDKVTPGTTKEIAVNGNKYRVHVYKVAPGYTFGAKWADMAIYQKELTLTNGQRLDQDENTNPGYRVLLGWKNLDPVSNSTANVGDVLRTIILYSDSVDQVSSSSSADLKTGDFMKVVQDPIAWKLTYKGLDLAATDRSTLRFTLQTGSDKQIGATDGVLNATGTRTNCTIYSPYMEVTSSDSGAVFRMTRTDPAMSGSAEVSDAKFYVALYGAGGLTVGARCGSTAVVQNYGVGSVFMKESSSGTTYGAKNYTNATGGLQVMYDKIGDGAYAFAPGNGGAILVERWDTLTPSDGTIGNLLNSSGINSAAYAPYVATLGLGTAPTLLFGISEKAGAGTSNDFVDYYVFGVQGTGTGSAGDSTFQFNSGDTTNYVTSDNRKIRYGHATKNAPVASVNASGYYNTSTAASNKLSGPVTQRTELVDEGHISERGSIFKSQTSSSMSFEMANKLGKAQWSLASSGNGTTTSASNIVNLKEGESATVSGVTVKVLQITETVGACSAAGAAASCTADMSGVSAVIMPNNAASVSVAVPYTGTYGNLVILDSDAVGVNTLVSVGGDKVNSVTAQLLQGSAVDWTAERKVVKEVVQGSKIVVAGKEATDTLEAANDFVGQVRRI